MTTEVYKKLNVYENKLSSALNNGFARFTRPELDAFSEVVREHRGSPLTNQERSCSRCFLRAIKAVAEDYFAFKKSPRAKKIEKENGEES